MQPASRYPYIQQLRELFLAPYAVQSIPPSLKLHPNTSDKRNRQAQVLTWPGPLKKQVIKITEQKETLCPRSVAC